MLDKTNQHKILLSNGLHKRVRRSSCTRVHNAGEEVKKKSVKTLLVYQKQYGRVDRFFLFLTPVLFLIFNTVYWGYFMC